MIGSRLWLFQRISSLFLLVYIIYIALFFVNNNNISYFDWTLFFLSFETRVLTSIFFIIVLVHGFIGLWTVGTDYLTPRTLGLYSSFANIADSLRKIYQAFFVLLGLFCSICIIYLIWS